MIFDSDSQLLTSFSANKIRNAIEDMVHNILSTKEIYLKYRIYERKKNNTLTTLHNKHVINWLYTIRCECGSGGLKFVESVLQNIRYTLKREMDERQFEYVKLIFDTCVTLRNLYKC